MAALWTCRVCSLQNLSGDICCVQCTCPKQANGVALSARKAAWEKGGTFSSPAKSAAKKPKAWFSKKHDADTGKLNWSTTGGQYLGTSVCVYLLAYAEYRSPLSGGRLGRTLDSIRDSFGPNAPITALLILATFLLILAYVIGNKKI